MAKKADIEIKKSNAGKFTAWAKKNIQFVRLLPQ